MTSPEITAAVMREAWRPWAESFIRRILLCRPAFNRVWLADEVQDAIESLPDADESLVEVRGDRAAFLDALQFLRRLLDEGADADAIDRAAFRVGAAWATFAPPRHLLDEVARHGEA